jgi:tRNA dimethylallyltransferase
MSPKPHLLFIVGPTACGKSDIAVEICETLKEHSPSEIINCDSVQFFKGVDIGAAKPSAELLNRARHHLIGHLPLGAEYTAGDFRRDALNLIETECEAAKQILSKKINGSVPTFIPVGGSGFYVQALEKGMYDVPQIPPEVRAQVEKDSSEPGGWVKLYTELKERDPEAAEKIKPGDSYRILRAIELLRVYTNGTLTELRAKFEANRPLSPFRVSKVGIFRPREILRQRVTERTRQMLKNGLIEEVISLREKGLKLWPPLSSVGYRETQDYLDGRLKLEELEPLIITSTMQLAKRQMTWFKRDLSIRWFDSEAGSRAPVQYAAALVTESVD